MAKFGIFVYLFLCISLCAASCDEGLVQKVLKAREGYKWLADNMKVFIREVESVEEFFGVPYMTESKWRELTCLVKETTIETEEDLKSLVDVVNSVGTYQLDWQQMESVLYFLSLDSEEQDQSTEIVAKYQAQMQPWLAKTGFPNVWPIQNSSKSEVKHLMKEGAKLGINVLTFDSHYWPKGGYKTIAKKMMHSGSLEEYLAKLQFDADSFMLWDYDFEINQIRLDMFRDNEKFGKLVQSREDCLAALRAFDYIWDVFEVYEANNNYYYGNYTYGNYTYEYSPY